MIAVDADCKLHRVGFSQRYAKSGFARRDFPVVASNTVILAAIGGALAIVGIIDVIADTDTIIGEIGVEVIQADSIRVGIRLQSDAQSIAGAQEIVFVELELIYRIRVEFSQVNTARREFFITIQLCGNI